ncbi:MAG: hypothetical protein HY747_07405 [Elusimicrobia bacterium]|nr:hypothetical protein [Elusimicrobiota bacterium]
MKKKQRIFDFSWKGKPGRLDFDELIKEWRQKNYPLGFLKPPDSALVEQICSTLEGKKRLFDDYVLLGIGGSSLPVKSLVNFFAGPHWNHLPQSQRQGRPRIWILDTIDPATIAGHPALTKAIMPRALIHVISKSGTTMEVELLRRHVLAKIEASQVIVTTTPDHGNKLNQWAARNRLPIFPLAADIGGRFSTFSPVAYTAAALLNLNLAAISQGAELAVQEAQTALKYAELLFREIKAGKTILGFFIYSDRLTGLGELLLQLFAESLGKNGRGFTPALFMGTRDQHSLLQLYLGGPKDKAVTLIHPQEPAGAGQSKDLPDLARNFWASSQGVAKSLKACKVPLFSITACEQNETAYGYLVQFFHLATIALGKLFNINPFDQPMVELQKKYTREYLEKSKTADKAK